jgi:cellulose synthase/poly-beta-1,6-N-acetylglucosamine synthase-like glycosyltransferase
MPDVAHAILQPAPALQEAEALCLTRLFLPCGSLILTADPSAENRAWLAARFPGRRIVTVSRACLLARLRDRLAPVLMEEAVFGLARRTPELSASRVLTAGQRLLAVGLAAGALLFLWRDPTLLMRLLLAFLSIAFVASGLFRTALAFLSAPSAGDGPLPADMALPRYTILVPLYREAAVLPALLAAMRALDYPPAKLDIKLVVEADDTETYAAAGALARGDSRFEIVPVPAGGPRTKPKAVNYALAFARGEYLVIYDAEDRPEPDQLKKAVARFRGLPRATACLQARLNFYNAEQNWLTKMFALDYAQWFDMLLPGLDRIGVPMPLGGTSNHFRTAVLRDIGGWDAFNVTEDADIGIRLSQLGYRVAMLDSTTFEEAPVAAGAWLRQRSRWLKGYMQTWLVHMRDPLALLRRTGILGFLAFQLFIGGGVMFALANPPLWIAFLAGLLFGWHAGAEAMSGASLVVNNLLLTYLAMMSPRRRGWVGLAPYGLTVVAYWGMVSVAGYRGLAQLVTRPFFWEKTMHGVTPP